MNRPQEELRTSDLFDLSRLDQDTPDAAQIAFDIETAYVASRAKDWLGLLGGGVRPYTAGRDASVEAYNADIAEKFERLALTFASKEYLTSGKITPPQFQFITEFFDVPRDASMNELLIATANRTRYMGTLRFAADNNLKLAQCCIEQDATEPTNSQPTAGFNIGRLIALREGYHNEES